MSGTHFSRLFPNGDPGNGYAEYLRAADAVDNDEVRAFIADTRSRAKDWKRLFRLAHPSMDRRKLTIKYKAVPDLIVSGNAKPLRSPYESDDPTLDLSEVQPIRHAGVVLSVAGGVAFEDFAPQKGVRLLCELMEYADRIGRDTALHLLIAQSLQSFAVTAFSGHFEAVPLEDRDALIERINDLLGRPTITMALKGERRYSLLRLHNSIHEVESYETDTPLLAEAKAKLKASSPTFKDQVQERVFTIIDETIDEMVRISGRYDLEWTKLLITEESPHWSNLATKRDAFGAPLEETPEGFARVLMQNSLSSWIQAFLATLRTRTRMRMLALHLHADTYRRKHGKTLPSLDLIDDQTLTFDCISTNKFGFESHPREVRIWSTGNAGVKPFGLNNQTPRHLGG